MSDDSKSHWKSLADELGAEAAHEPPARPETASPETPAAPPREKRAPKPAAPRPKNHWGDVLGAVGLEAPAPESEEVEQGETVEASVVDIEAVDEPEGAARSDQVEDVSEEEAQSDYAPVADSEPVLETEVDEITEEPEESDPLVMDTENVIDAVASAVIDDEDTEEQTRRRRRRRGGRRRPRRTPDEEAEASAEVADVASDVTEAEDAGGEQSIGEGEPSDETDEASEERPRRRRRRRRGRRSEAEGEQSDAAEVEDGEVEVAAVSETSASDEEDDNGEDRPRRRRRRRRKPRRDADETSGDATAETGELEEAVDKDEDARANPKHRKIPSWAEAIDMIVQSNLTARAKSKPSRGRRRSSPKSD